jgi:HEAT repeat protein
MTNPRAAVHVIAGLLAVSRMLPAQHCAQVDSGYAKPLAEAVRACTDSAVFRVAAAWEHEAIPGLRALLAPGATDCEETRNAARAALAKLGDSALFDVVVAELRGQRLNDRVIKHLGLIGDDRAIHALMAYMVETDSYLARIVDLGDVNYDPHDAIRAAMRDLARRRPLRDGPSGEAIYTWDWGRWWQQSLGTALSTPIHDSVRDRRLRCLARQVEWGFPDAILDLARLGGESAIEVLGRFPRYMPRQPFGRIDGNLQAAFARLGDQTAFHEIAAELREKQSYYSPPVRKLAFIGSRAAVAELISVLGVPTKALVGAREAMSRPTRDPNARFLAEDTYRVEAQIDREFHMSILQVLARMVKEPPVGPNARPTPENIKAWQNWWVANRDRFELAGAPPGNFE